MNGSKRRALLLTLIALALTSAFAVYAKPGVVFKAVARETFFTNGFTGQGTWDMKSWSGMYPGSKLVVVGHGSLGKGDLMIARARSPRSGCAEGTTIASTSHPSSTRT